MTSISDLAVLLFVVFWTVFGLSVQWREARAAQAERERRDRVAALYPRRDR
jgi:hypothetical protein